MSAVFCISSDSSREKHCCTESADADVILVSFSIASLAPDSKTSSSQDLLLASDLC